MVSTTQNGSGLTAQTVNFYDSEGNLTWSKDAHGFLTENIYDPTTGLVTEGIQDANTALVNPSELPTDPTTGQPLATPAGGGQNLVTDYSYDAEARLAQTLGPEHSAVVDGVATEVRTASWTVYDDADHATFSCQGYETVASGRFTLVNPVSVTITNPDGQVTNQIQATVDANDGTVGWVANAADAEVSLGSLSPLALLATTASGGIGLPPQSAYTAWTTDEYSHKQLVSTRVYTNIADGCYNQTSYGYDMDGRQQWTETPAGTITWNVLDSQDQTMSTWVGTDDTPTNPLAPWSPSNNDGNMVNVTDTRYDADGDVTSVTQHVGGGTPDRTTLYAYDWRDRQTFAVNPPDAQSRITYATTQYDNLDEATETQQYEYEGSNLGDGLAAAAVAGSAELTTSDLLLAQGVTAYDSQGNVYRTTQYGVTPSGGLDATTLVSNAWYDANGNVIKSQPAGSDEFTKQRLRRPRRSDRPIRRLRHQRNNQRPLRLVGQRHPAPVEQRNLPRDPDSV